MRLKSGIWVSAYIRRCAIEGAFAVVRRRGAEEAGAVFVKVDRLDGTADLFGPAPQTEFDDAHPVERAFMAVPEGAAGARTKTRRVISRARSASIPICGSSKSRTAPGGISSIALWGRLTPGPCAVRDPAAPTPSRSRRAACAVSLARVRRFIVEMHRPVAVAGRDAGGSAARQIATIRKAASCVISS